MDESTKYRDLISQSSKDQQEKEELDFLVEDAAQQVDADILETKKQIRLAKKALSVAESAKPLVPSSCVAAAKNLKGYEAGLTYLEDLKKRRF